MSPDAKGIREAYLAMDRDLQADIEMIVRGLHVCGPLPAYELITRMVSAPSEGAGHGVIELARSLGLIRKAKMMFATSSLDQRWALMGGMAPQTLDPAAPPSPFTGRELPAYF